MIKHKKSHPKTAPTYKNESLPDIQSLKQCLCKNLTIPENQMHFYYYFIKLFALYTIANVRWTEDRKNIKFVQFVAENIVQTPW